MTDLNEDTKEKEKIEMFNNLVNDKKYAIPKEEEIPNWVLAGEFIICFFLAITKDLIRIGLFVMGHTLWTWSKLDLKGFWTVLDREILIDCILKIGMTYPFGF